MKDSRVNTDDPTVALLSNSQQIVDLHNGDDQIRLERERFERARWHSLYLIYFVMFIGSVGFSVNLPVLWPFLQRIGGTKSFLGFIVAGFSFGQMLSNPLFGYWSNKASAAYPLSASLMISTIGNVMFCFCDVVSGPEGERFMLAARLISKYLRVKTES